ncbi:hypothetical protein D3C72_1366440 [compost metagenome]
MPCRGAGADQIRGRGGVGGIGLHLGPVGDLAAQRKRQISGADEVYAHADHHRVAGFSAAGVAGGLDQDACQLGVMPLHVVGPLHAQAPRVEARDAAQCFAGGYTSQRGQRGQLRGGQMHVECAGEHQRGAGAVLPRAARAAAAGFLQMRTQQPGFAAAGAGTGARKQVGVGRSGAFCPGDVLESGQARAERPG